MTRLRPPCGWPAAAGPGTCIPLVTDHFRLLVPAGHPLADRPAVTLAQVADDRWTKGWDDVGEVAEMLAALSGFRPNAACRASDYRFMSALVGADVGVALVPSLALTGSPQVRDLPITPQPTRYIGAWLPGGTSPIQSPSGCSTHGALTRWRYRRPRADVADRRRPADQAAHGVAPKDWNQDRGGLARPPSVPGIHMPCGLILVSCRSRR